MNWPSADKAKNLPKLIFFASTIKSCLGFEIFLLTTYPLLFSVMKSKGSINKTIGDFKSCKSYQSNDKLF